jgi:hypothetical protein
MIDLSDVTFCMPIRVDCQERLENLKLTVDFLQKNFKTNIHVWEDGPTSDIQLEGINYTFVETDNPIFHRTKIMNLLCKEATTPIIVNPYDCDVILPVERYVHAVEEIRQDRADAIYPYDGTFINIDRHWIPLIVEQNGPQNVADGNLLNSQSFGGCMFWNRSKFITYGMQNERFISWGPEDVETYERITKLGARIGRLQGVMYHLDHPRGINSGSKNPFMKFNDMEHSRIKSLSTEVLREEIMTWAWVRENNND